MGFRAWLGAEIFVGFLRGRILWGRIALWEHQNREFMTNLMFLNQNLICRVHYAAYRRGSSHLEESDMKVAILAAGKGTRLAEETSVRPKPMVEIGGRPIL